MHKIKAFKHTKKPFLFFLPRLTRQILFDNTRSETFQVKVTLEISKRNGNSRQNFATEEETFLDCRENWLFQEI